MSIDLTAPALRRARDLDVPFDGTPGPRNAITDVAGLTVGMRSRVDATGACTGVTAVFPRGRFDDAGVAAAVFAFNGTGELTGAHQIKEFGAFFGPVLLTGTTAVGTVSEAYLRWVAAHVMDEDHRFARILPVVAETWDGNLNDAWGFHLRADDVMGALDDAQVGAVPEGNVGGGTGMVCHGFKGGTGTASRVVEVLGQPYTVGVLVQANHGQRDDLLIGGLPVGRLIEGYVPEVAAPLVDGSIIVAIATDAPVSSAQLERLAKRATIGLARCGGFGGALSGDIFLAFSTATLVRLADAGLAPQPDQVPGDALDPLFHGVAWATEEAIVNALVAATTTTSAQGVTVHGLPHAPLQALMRKRKELLHD